MQVTKDLKEATKDTNIQKPVVLLADIYKRTKVWLLLLTYLGCVKGAEHIPLAFLIYNHNKVTD
jgi:nitrate/nitrite transporter NarK